MATVSMPMQAMADDQDSRRPDARNRPRARRPRRRTLALTPTDAKNGALLAMAAMLRNFDGADPRRQCHGRRRPRAGAAVRAHSSTG